MKTISDKDFPIKIPRGVITCPKCNYEVMLEAVDVYLEDGSLDNNSEISINCIMEPGIDSKEWEDWHKWHWSTPYIDWLPLEKYVIRWFNANYRMGEDVTEKLKRWNENAAGVYRSGAESKTTH